MAIQTASAAAAARSEEVAVASEFPPALAELRSAQVEAERPALPEAVEAQPKCFRCAPLAARQAAQSKETDD